MMKGFFFSSIAKIITLNKSALYCKGSNLNVYYEDLLWISFGVNKYVP